MIEKVNPSHPDKVADRIAGAIVDIAYLNEENPKVAVEVLIGHGECNIIIESSVDFNRPELQTNIKHKVYEITKTNDLDNDEMGIVKIEYGQVVLKKRNGETKPLCDYVEKEFDQYISNVGEIYKYKNNIVLGYIKR